MSRSRGRQRRASCGPSELSRLDGTQCRAARGTVGVITLVPEQPLSARLNGLPRADWFAPIGGVVSRLARRRSHVYLGPAKAVSDVCPSRQARAQRHDSHSPETAHDPSPTADKVPMRRRARNMTRAGSRCALCAARYSVARVLLLRSPVIRSRHRHEVTGEKIMI